MKPAHPTCPIIKTAELLSDVWTMLIIRALLRSPKHFCELERDLKGISSRTLTGKLMKLEKERILRKHKTGNYALTPKGKGLRTVEGAMRRYGEAYL